MAGIKTQTGPVEAVKPEDETFTVISTSIENIIVLEEENVSENVVSGPITSQEDSGIDIIEQIR